MKTQMGLVKRFFALFPSKKKCEVGSALGVGTEGGLRPIHPGSSSTLLRSGWSSRWCRLCLGPPYGRISLFCVACLVTPFTLGNLYFAFAPRIFRLARWNLDIISTSSPSLAVWGGFCCSVQLGALDDEEFFIIEGST